MSQEIKTKSVRIKNIAALQKAVQTLRQQGKNVELVKDGKCRLWSGSTRQCDWVLKLNNRRFDVGLIRSKTKNPNDEAEYELGFDDWDGEVFNELGKEIEGITHLRGHTSVKSGHKFTQEEITLSNVNNVLTEYYKETFSMQAQSHGYTMSSEHEKNEETILEYAV
jgi:predicted nucleic acid-binding Zn finger protein